MTRDDLKYIQKELGFTLQQMADALNVPRTSYEKWLYGVNPIPEPYENYLRGMQEAIKQDKKQKLQDMIGLGFIALGAFALTLLLTETDDNPDDDED